ncbi:rifin [Plasmodium falciparum NF54]|uniref:Rifin n=2 Tax=Plasmodium falciparum TaxID=5833 RepID=Q8I2E5_PLAF7|nr:rifin [Plasmodium falciparum 3D7]KAF4330595.1 rifin [Plasmodium falciparum NF54]PKC45030.1 rifin [Plasmodium falciparum NF54]CAD52049.1 rifin [Plasmodium falciparum 3D7]|eukprot:XP_001352239.1 rifin [Plasmodium falciparum 3D7]
MKIHYTNILLFPLKLNILVNTHKKPSITARHIQTTRLLCECELFSPQNYDNDPEMKRVMQQFHDRTTQRFHEYDERMKTTRQECKEQCDKEIQKIILKDKMEKQMAEKLSTLETKINTDDIPTCVCEKSMADKTEKFCLNCGKNMAAIAPWWGLVCGSGYAGWLHSAMAAAIDKAIAEGAAAGIKAGHLAGTNAVIEQLRTLGIYFVGNKQLETIIDVTNYMNVSFIYDKVYSHYITLCTPRPVNGHLVSNFNFSDRFCKLFHQKDLVSLDIKSVKAIIKKNVEEAVAGAEQAAKAEVSNVTATKTTEFTTKNIAEVEAATTSYYTPIIASIVAIVIIVLIMVIIYKILRYRRKKKMKKKLQYIKLLEE